MTTTHARVLRMVDPREPVALLKRFVRAPSESGREGPMADALVAALAEAGVRDVRRDDHHNVLVTLRGRSEGPRRLFLAHLDTGAPGKMADPSEPHILPGGPFGKTGNVLRGRGACAPKATVAALAAAAAALARAGLPETGVAYIAAVTKDLRANHEGVRELLESFPLEIDWMVAGEPSSNRIVLGARGINQLRFELSGVPAHWGRPAEAANPLYALADLLSAIERLPLPAHPVLGNATLSPFDVRSDASPPLSPHRAELRIDRRTLPGETTAQVVGAFEGMLADVLAGRPRITGSVVLERAMHSFETPVESALTRRIQERVREALSCEIETMYITFASNASYGIAERGWPGVALGPGDIRDVGDEEHVELAQVEEATRIYAVLMAE
jgi:acetylornithine deacetylase/succinyl-diaminopimelate desuccinylase-like protein